MERFRSLTRSHYRGALGALLGKTRMETSALMALLITTTFWLAVYDASNPWSLTEMENWLGELRTFATDSATMVVGRLRQLFMCIFEPRLIHAEI